MIHHFYSAVKQAINDKFPAIRRVDYDYGQWQGEKPDKPNYSGKAFYIFFPEIDIVTNSIGACKTTEDFYFEVVYVEHSIKDGDTRIGGAHWATVTELCKLLNLRSFNISDVPGSGVAEGSSEDRRICSSLNLAKIKPETELSQLIVTRVGFNCIVAFWDIVIEEDTAIINPELNVEIIS